MRARLAALGAVLALLALAGVAVAATPSKGLHKGRTSQDRKVDVKVGSDHKVRRFRIDWRAPCDTPNSHWGPDGTTVNFPSDQPGGGKFASSGKYKGKADKQGYRGHFRYELDGKFTTSNQAHGSFDIKVRVTRNGKTVDHCQKAVTWQVS